MEAELSEGLSESCVPVGETYFFGGVFWGGFLGGFWKGFGRVLGGFWEAKILDFHAFFDVFSMSFLKSVSEEQKISPRDPTRRRMRKFSGGFLWSPASWGEKKRGEQEPRLA